MPARYYPVILYWLCFLGLIVWAISHDIQNSQPTQLSAQNKEGQPNQTQNPDKQINSSASGLIRFIVELGKNDESKTDWGKPNCTQPQNHDEADLCQQIKMVYIANDTYELSRKQAILSLVAIVVAIASIIYAGMAASAARTSANALPVLERAYVHLHAIDPIEIKLHLGSLISIAQSRRPHYPSASAAIKNYGKTPASFVGGEFVIDVTEDIPPKIIPPKIISTTPNPATQGEPEEVDIFIGEDEVYNLGSFRSKTQYSVDIIMEIKSGDRAIYSHGWIRYIDIFIKPHDILFCRRYNVSRDSFVPVGGKERNHMD